MLASRWLLLYRIQRTEIQRVDVHTILPDFIVEVWPTRLAGRANITHDLASLDRLAVLYRVLLQMCKGGLIVFPSMAR
jgi:hypothetical protein